MINIDSINFSYSTEKAIFKDFSLTIDEHESIGIVGNNGAGKSTLLKLISGILKQSSGTITVNNIINSKQTMLKYKQNIGYIFQNPDDQLFMSNVFEDIAFALRNFGFDNIDERVENIMETLGITHLKSASTLRLSGGEKRSVAMAGVLVMDPPVMLFDEPTAFLDHRSRRSFIEFCKTLNKTKVIVSHDLNYVLESCRRVIIINEGTIVADGEPSKLFFDRKLMESAYLEMPK